MEAQFAKPRLSDYYRPVIAPKRNMPTIFSIWCHCASIFRPKNDLGGFLSNTMAIWGIYPNKVKQITEVSTDMMFFWQMKWRNKRLEKRVSL